MFKNVIKRLIIFSSDRNSGSHSVCPCLSELKILFFFVKSPPGSNVKIQLCIFAAHCWKCSASFKNGICRIYVREGTDGGGLKGWSRQDLVVTVQLGEGRSGERSQRQVLNTAPQSAARKCSVSQWFSIVGECLSFNKFYCLTFRLKISNKQAWCRDWEKRFLLPEQSLQQTTEFLLQK